MATTDEERAPLNPSEVDGAVAISMVRPPEMEQDLGKQSLHFCMCAHLLTPMLIFQWKKCSNAECRMWNAHSPACITMLSGRTIMLLLMNHGVMENGMLGTRSAMEHLNVSVR